MASRKVVRSSDLPSFSVPKTRDMQMADKDPEGELRSAFALFDR